MVQEAYSPSDGDARGHLDVPAPGARRHALSAELAEAVYWVMTAATALRALDEATVALAGALGLRWLVALRARTAGRHGTLRAEQWRRMRMPPATPPTR
jgi:hypothetical protein